MTKATFNTIEAAAAVMNKTGRTWTPVKAGGGFQIRANMPNGWRYIETIDVYHIENSGMYRALRTNTGSIVAVS